ncbi:MAG: terminase small subunit [Eubacteriales bacterium]
MNYSKKIFPDAAAFAERAARYFRECDDSVIPSAACTSCKNEDAGACASCMKKRTKPYTLSGLCLALGISKRQFKALKTNKCFCNEVEMALLKIETYIEESCICGNINGTFALAMLKEYFGFGEAEESENIKVTLSGKAGRLSE